METAVTKDHPARVRSTMVTKLYYVANTRMPNERAHGIQIAKMCEAFVREGIPLTLIVPNRTGPKEALDTFYHLSVPVKLVRLPTLDWYRNGPKLYRLSSVSFMISYILYLWWKKLCGEKFVLYTVDLDNYSSSGLSLVPAPLYSEMHGGKEYTPMQKVLFKGVDGIIATNPITAGELQKKFPWSHAKYIVEPNGVDIESFTPISKEEARTKLGLPSNERIVLYTGRLLDWKGLPILAEAAAKAESGVRWYIVGGTEEEYLRTTGLSTVPESMVFMGSQPHSLISTWLSAADVLVVLGTAKDTQSYNWTSPMKLFEYLLSKRPIVAAGTPAIKTIVTTAEVLLYEPDSVEDLAEQVHVALNLPPDDVRMERARTLGTTFSWEGRGERITRFIGF